MRLLQLLQLIILSAGDQAPMKGWVIGQGGREGGGGSFGVEGVEKKGMRQEKRGQEHHGGSISSVKLHGYRGQP